MVEPGLSQAGNYRLVRLLGRGGFADVYLGEHIYLKTPAAIKVLRTRLNEKERESFLNEARLVARLEHSHIVRVLEFGVDTLEELPFLIMEYAPRGTVCQQFPRGQRQDLSALLPIVRQVADALQYAHDRRMVHCDVKPENMLLDAENEVLLSDFGIALVQKGTRSQSAGEVIGTVAYMAPEQLHGRPKAASDQYALGICVYEWLCGQRPFNGGFVELAGQHVLASPRPLREYIPSLPLPVEQVVLRALAKDPRQRFARVLDFAQALEAAARAFPAGTTPQLPAAFPLNSASQPGSLSAAPTQIPPVQTEVGYALPNQASPMHQSAHVSPQPGHFMPASYAPVLQSPVPEAEGQQTRKVFSTGMKVLLAILLLLLLVGNGLIFAIPAIQARSTAVSQPPTPTSVSPTQTPTAGTPTPQQLYQMVTSRAPAIHDPLNGSDTLQWDTEPADCVFRNGALHARHAGGKLSICTIGSSIFFDFAFQVNITLLQGKQDLGGLIFRFDATTASNYMFLIDASGNIGLDLLTANYTTGTSAASSILYIARNNPNVFAGLGKQNTLTVIVQKSAIYLYVNQHYVTTISDSSVTQGVVGLANMDQADQASDIAFTDALLWTL